MKPTEQKRFDTLYKQHLRGLKLHGYSASTMNGYSRAERRFCPTITIVFPISSVSNNWKSILPPLSIVIPGLPSEWTATACNSPGNTT